MLPTSDGPWPGEPGARPLHPCRGPAVVVPAEVGDAGQVACCARRAGHLQPRGAPGPRPTLCRPPLPLTSVAPDDRDSPHLHHHRAAPASTAWSATASAATRGHESPALAARRLDPASGPARSFQTRRPSGAPGTVRSRLWRARTFAATGFTAPHLSGWHTTRGTPPRPLVESQPPRRGGAVRLRLLRPASTRCHAKGWARTTRPSSQRSTSWSGDLAGALPPGAALVVTADHGQSTSTLHEVLPAEVMDGVTLLSGEGPLPWCNQPPRPPRRAGPPRKFADVPGCDREQLNDEHWSGRAGARRRRPPR